MSYGLYGEYSVEDIGTIKGLRDCDGGFNIELGFDVLHNHLIISSQEVYGSGCSR